MKIFRLRPYHFALGIMLLILFCRYAGEEMLKHNAKHSRIPLAEVRPTHLGDSIRKGLTMVLFYTPGSELSGYMKERLVELKAETKKGVRFYQVDISRNDSLMDKYDISLAPLVLAFKDGKEHQRAMGIIPLSNLEMICERLATPE